MRARALPATPDEDQGDRDGTVTVLRTKVLGHAAQSSATLLVASAGPRLFKR